MKIEAVDLFYLAMPEVLDIGDGSQDALLVRVQAGDAEGWANVRLRRMHALLKLDKTFWEVIRTIGTTVLFTGSAVILNRPRCP